MFQGELSLIVGMGKGNTEKTYTERVKRKVNTVTSLVTRLIIPQCWGAEEDEHKSKPSQGDF